jgi:hypothetical protein
MTYYVLPDDRVVRSWSQIQKVIGWRVSVPADPPDLPKTYGEKTVYKMVETAPNMAAHQTVTSREIQISNGKALEVYTVEDKPLEQYKEERRAEVNTLRDEKMISDFTYDSVVYQADDLSQARLDRARASALAAIVGGAQPGDYRWHGQAQDFFWIAKDNSLNVMDAQTTLAFGNAMVAREGMLIAAGTAIKSAIDACATVQEVAAIDITTGWPS